MNRPTPHHPASPAEAGYGTDDSLTGSTIAGFQVVSVLGHDSDGTTLCQVVNGQSDSTAVLRLASPAAQPELGARFLHDARLLGDLGHHNLPAVRALGESSEGWYVVTEARQGRDLAGARDAGRPPTGALRIAGVIAEALDAAHAVDLLHRRVRPANVIVDEDRVMLVGFALGARRQAPLADDRQAPYVSPEELRGELVGPPGDRYALACTLFQLLTGRPPFGESKDALRGHLNGAPPQVTALRPDLPPALDAVFRRALAKRPGERHPSCAELVSEAARTLFGLPGPRDGPRRHVDEPSIGDRAMAPRHAASEPVSAPAGTAESQPDDQPEAPAEPAPIHQIAPTWTPREAAELWTPPPGARETRVYPFRPQPPEDEPGSARMNPEPAHAHPEPEADRLPPEALAETLEWEVQGELYPAPDGEAAQDQIPMEDPAAGASPTFSEPLAGAPGRSDGEPALELEAEPEPERGQMAAEPPESAENRQPAPGPQADFASPPAPDTEWAAQPDPAPSMEQTAEWETISDGPAEGSAGDPLHAEREPHAYEPAADGTGEQEDTPADSGAQVVSITPADGPAAPPPWLGADDPPPIALLPEAADASVTNARASGPRKATRATAPLSLSLAAVAAAATGGLVLGHETDDPAPAPRTATAGSLSVEVPPGWRQSSAVPRLAGLELERTLGVVPPRGGGVIMGIRSEARAVGDPASVAERVDPSPPRPSVVRLGGLEAYRWEGLRAQAGRGTRNLELYVAPTSAGAIALACYGSSTASLPETACGQVAGSLRLAHGTGYSPLRGDRWRASLGSTMHQLGRQRAAGIARLGSAVDAGGQADAAAFVGRAHGAAARDLMARPAPPQTVAARDRIVAALRGVEGAYRSLRRAAAAADPAGYASARQTVERRDTELRRQLQSI